jgi:hypothetical protein
METRTACNKARTRVAQKAKSGKAKVKRKNKKQKLGTFSFLVP